MTKLLLLIFLFFCFTTLGQTAIIVTSKTAILKDSLTNCIYVLDSFHTSITAYDSHGDRLWTSFTYDCSYTNDPVDTSAKPIKQEIRSMKFSIAQTPLSYCNDCTGEKVIWVTYCHCEGFFRLKTGRFYSGDCD